MLEEHKYLVAGNSTCTHTIEGITFGFAICYDIRFCQFERKEGIKQITINQDLVSKISKEIPVVADRRPELY